MSTPDRSAEMDENAVDKIRLSRFGACSGCLYGMIFSGVILIGITIGALLFLQ